MIAMSDPVDGTDIPNDPNCTFFPQVAAEEWLDLDFKGFAYCLKPPPDERVATQLDSMGSQAGPTFRHLEGHWYLFRFWT